MSGHWQKSLNAFERALELGYQDELVPASILPRLKQSDDQGDEIYQQLMLFLEEHSPQLPDNEANRLTTG